MSSGGDGPFPATMRVKKRDDFRMAYGKGKAWKGPCFSLHVLHRQDPSDLGLSARLGLVVTKRWGSAVERNRVKRRIREAFRRCASQLPPVDILVRPRSACRTMEIERLARELVEAVHAATKTEVKR